MNEKYEVWIEIIKNNEGLKKMVLKKQTNKKKCMKQIKQKLNHKKQKKRL